MSSVRLQQKPAVMFTCTRWKHASSFLTRSVFITLIWTTALTASPPSSSELLLVLAREQPLSPFSHWWSDAAPAQIRLIEISSARDKDSHHTGRQLHYRITAAGVWSNMEASWTQKTKQGGVYRVSTGPNRHFQLNSESKQQSSADGPYWLMLHRNTNPISVSFLSLSPLHPMRRRKEHLDLSEDWQSHSPPFPRLSWGKSVFKWTEPPMMWGMNSQFKVSLSPPVVNIFEANSVWHNRGTDSRYGNRQTSIQQCLQELFGKSYSEEEIRDQEASSKLVIFSDN